MAKPLWMQVREAFERKGYFPPSPELRDELVGIATDYADQKTAAAHAEIERLTHLLDLSKKTTEAVLERAEKAEAERDEALAQVALEWIAVGAGKGGCGLPCGYDCNGACFAPPADADREAGMVELDRLIAAVELGGTPHGDVFFGAYRIEQRNAYHGSLDAALALHKALLPGWSITLENDDGNIHAAVWPCGEIGEQHGAEGPTLARALLLAILRAYRQQRDGQA